MGAGKLLLPVGLAFAGLGAGIGAGMALKPTPEAEEAEAGHGAACAQGEAECGGAAGAQAAEPDPFAPAPPRAKPEPEGEVANVALEKPFVVPVFRGERIVAMVVASVAIEMDAQGAASVEARTPRLRDAFLAAMFRHANSGGFDGAFTEGRKVEDLRAALVAAAQGVFGETAVYDVLITEILRQDS